MSNEPLIKKGLNFRIGEASENPKETARRKRRMKGAERRMATHKARLDRYRKIIAERAVESTTREGEHVTKPLAEPEWDEYRMKRLVEEAKYMAAKRDYIAYREMYESRVAANSDALRELLASERATVFANRNARRYTRVVVEKLRKGEAGGSPILKNLSPLTKGGHRKEFRAAVMKFLKDVDPITSELFEKKPKLFSRVIEELAAQIRDMDADLGGAE